MAATRRVRTRLAITPRADHLNYRPGARMVRPDRVRRSRSQRRCTVCGHPCGLSVGMSRAWWREVAAGPLAGPCGGSPVTDPKKSELATRSDELLDAVRRLKDTEQRKRQEPIS